MHAQSRPTSRKSPTPRAMTKRFLKSTEYRKKSLRSNMGPNTRNARRATIGKVTKVAAINASEVLQRVKIPDKAIIAIIERVV